MKRLKQKIRQWLELEQVHKITEAMNDPANAIVVVPDHSLISGSKFTIPPGKHLIFLGDFIHIANSSVEFTQASKD